MHVLELFRARLIVSGKSRYRSQRDFRHRQLALRILTDRPGRLINVRIENETLSSGEVKGKQQMATGYGGDESLFRIDILFDGHRDRDDVRRRGSRELRATVEEPSVPAAVLVIEEILVASLPSDRGAVI